MGSIKEQERATLEQIPPDSFTPPPFNEAFDFNQLNEIISRRSSGQLHLLLEDAKSKISIRKEIVRWLLGMLVGQNIAVYAFCFYALMHGQIEAIGNTLKLLTVGTLLETYLIAKVMIQWVFSDVKSR